MDHRLSFVAEKAIPSPRMGAAFERTNAVHQKTVRRRA
jgi:hypothetical protein